MKVSEDWGASAVCHVVEPNVDPVSDVARIVVEAGTGQPASLASPTSPKIIHLEFVVRPNAVHGEVVEFYLQKVRATIFRDTIIELLIPTTPKFTYKVHSYISVWPGDTDNNGMVDDIDFALISKYLEEPKQKMRAFKRNPTSTLWKPQQVIAWDTLAATYCDTDGNGVITNSDHLVVVYNMDSVWNINHKSNINYPILTVGSAIQFNNKTLYKENCIYVPVNINNTSNSIIAAAGTFDIKSLEESTTTNNSKYKLHGIQRTDYFGAEEKTYCYINQDSTWINFVIRGVVNKNNFSFNGSEESKQPLFYLIFEPKTDEFDMFCIEDIKIQDFVGITEDNSIIDLEQEYSNSNIERDVFSTFSNNCIINYSDKNLGIASKEIIKSIKIINYIGETVADYSAIGDYATNFKLNNICNGLYFVIVNSKYMKNIFINN